MPRWYRVAMPITGTIEIELVADNEDHAVELAVEQFTIDNIVDWCEDESDPTVEEGDEVEDESVEKTP